MNGFIYKITNRVNGKVYIGQTRFTVEHRFKQHYKNFNIEHRRQPLYYAFAKYGAENFAVETVEECPVEKLNEREIYWIAYYDSFRKGYNATLGGSGTAKYFWTDNQYEEIKSLYLSGFSIKDLCERYNASNYTIKAILDSMNIKVRKPLDFNNYELQKVITEYKAGTPLHSLSSKYGVSFYTMKEFLQNHGIDTKDRYNIMEDTSKHQEVVNDFLNGMKYKNMEEKYHTDTRTLKKILVTQGINLKAYRGLRQTTKGAFCMTDEQCLEAIKLYNDKVPVQKIADKFGVHITTLYALFKRYHVKCSRYNHSKSVQTPKNEG